MENKYAEHVAKVLKEACKEAEMNAEKYVADVPFINEFTLTIRLTRDGENVAFPTIEACTKSYPTNSDKYVYMMREAYFDSLKEEGK